MKNWRPWVSENISKEFNAGSAGYSRDGKLLEKIRGGLLLRRVFHTCSCRDCDPKSPVRSPVDVQPTRFAGKAERFYSKQLKDSGYDELRRRPRLWKRNIRD